MNYLVYSERKNSSKCVWQAAYKGVFNANLLVYVKAHLLSGYCHMMTGQISFLSAEVVRLSSKISEW